MRRLPGPYCDRHNRPMRWASERWDGDWVCPAPANHCRIRISRARYAGIAADYPEAAVRVFA